MNQRAVETIDRYRRVILIHSCLYYHMDTNIVSDKQFDTWAKELVALQKIYPKEAEVSVWADEFRGFDGTTGFDLPFTDPWVVEHAQRVLQWNGKSSKIKDEKKERKHG